MPHYGILVSVEISYRKPDRIRVVTPTLRIALYDDAKVLITPIIPKSDISESKFIES